MTKTIPKMLWLLALMLCGCSKVYTRASSFTNAKETESRCHITVPESDNPLADAEYASHLRRILDDAGYQIADQAPAPVLVAFTYGYGASHTETTAVPIITTTGGASSYSGTSWSGGQMSSTSGTVSSPVRTQVTGYTPVTERYYQTWIKLRASDSEGKALWAIDVDGDSKCADPRQVVPVLLYEARRWILQSSGKAVQQIYTVPSAEIDRFFAQAPVRARISQEMSRPEVQP